MVSEEMVASIPRFIIIDRYRPAAGFLKPAKCIQPQRPKPANTIGITAPNIAFPRLHRHQRANIFTPIQEISTVSTKRCSPTALPSSGVHIIYRVFAGRTR
jgi:hypothetical protein